MAASELENTIADNAAAPAEVRVDNISAKQHALRDQIEADRYAKQNAAARRDGLGIRFVKLVPPGTV